MPIVERVSFFFMFYAMKIDDDVRVLVLCSESEDSRMKKYRRNDVSFKKPGKVIHSFLFSSPASDSLGRVQTCCGAGWPEAGYKSGDDTDEHAQGYILKR